MPKSDLIVSMRFWAPASGSSVAVLYAVLMRCGSPLGMIGIHRSRGNETRSTVWASGSTRAIMIVSARWPDWSAPVSSRNAPASSSCSLTTERLSEPTIR